MVKKHIKKKRLNAYGTRLTNAAKVLDFLRKTLFDMRHPTLE
jgi:hypothetical protein